MSIHFIIRISNTTYLPLPRLKITRKPSLSPSVFLFKPLINKTLQSRLSLRPVDSTPWRVDCLMWLTRWGESAPMLHRQPDSIPQTIRIHKRNSMMWNRCGWGWKLCCKDAERLKGPCGPPATRAFGCNSSGGMWMGRTMRRAGYSCR